MAIDRKALAEVIGRDVQKAREKDSNTPAGGTPCSLAMATAMVAAATRALANHIDALEAEVRALKQHAAQLEVRLERSTSRASLQWDDEDARHDG